MKNVVVYYLIGWIIESTRGKNIFTILHVQSLTVDWCEKKSVDSRKNSCQHRKNFVSDVWKYTLPVPDFITHTHTEGFPVKQKRFCVRKPQLPNFRLFFFARILLHPVPQTNKKRPSYSAQVVNNLLQTGSF